MEVLRPLRSLREIKDNSVFVLHAECAKSAEIYYLLYSALALKGRKLRYDERAQRCAVSGERGAEERRNGIGHRWHRCDRFSQIVVNYHLSVSIGIVGVISGQFFMFIFVVSENSIIFALNSVATAVV